MKKLVLMSVLGVFALFSSFAIANTNHGYVNSDQLNVRDTPNGEIIDKIYRGEKVYFYDTLNNWVNISQEKDYPRWISTKFLCYQENCYIQKQQTSITGSKTVTLKKTQTYTPIKESESIFNGSCPCSSSYNCTGPRGGRYCYTSGGNKRYR